MKRAALFATLLSALPFSAFAAEGPPVQAASWSGFYIGANAGYGWSANSVTTNVTSSSCSQNQLGPFCFILLPHATAAVPSRFNIQPSGFIGGGQLGYSFQNGPVVWGVETDFSGTDIHGANTQTETESFKIPVGRFSLNFNQSVTGTVTQRLDYLGTLRGRIGFTPIAPLLVYATGGLAYGHGSSSTSLDETLNTFAHTPGFGSFSGMRVGWTIGGGFEWMFARNWSIKAEYLYYNLGSATYASTPATITTTTTMTSVGVSSHVDFKGNIVRAGLNYRFDLFAPPAPVVAKY